jgi:hypothetical protein
VNEPHDWGQTVASLGAALSGSGIGRFMAHGQLAKRGRAPPLTRWTVIEIVGMGGIGFSSGIYLGWSWGVSFGGGVLLGFIGPGALNSIFNVALRKAGGDGMPPPETEPEPASEPEPTK